MVIAYYVTHSRPMLLGTGPGTRTPNQLIKSKLTEKFMSHAPNHMKRWSSKNNRLI